MLIFILSAEEFNFSCLWYTSFYKDLESLFFNSGSSDELLLEFFDEETPYDFDDPELELYTEHLSSFLSILEEVKLVEEAGQHKYTRSSLSGSLPVRVLKNAGVINIAYL